MEAKPITGGCQCGAIRYQLTAEPTEAANCHCSDCRRACGAQAVAWVTVPVDDFVVTKGTLKEYASSGQVIRTFCSQCGTTLTYRHETWSSGVDITTGSLDHPERFPPTKDVFCRDKLPWVKLATDNAKD